MNTTLIPLVGPEPHTPEWYKVHRTHITATDIAPILGRSEYKTALDVFMEKTGKAAPFEGNEHTRRGQRYEPVILADYADKMGVEIKTHLPLYFHPLVNCLAATPDASVPKWGHGENPTEPEYGVEAKFSMSPARASGLGEEGTDDIPDDWLLQTQTQMSVMGWPRDDLAALLFGRLRIYPVLRNDDLIAIIESAANEMHERVLADDPPEPNWEHPQTARLVKSLYAVREGAVIDMPQECDAFFVAYQELGKDITARQKERDAIKARLLYAMGEAEIGRLPGIDMEVIRSTVERKEYVVAASTYTTFRGRKSRT